jgi:hypothetical protein
VRRVGARSPGIDAGETRRTAQTTSLRRVAGEAIAPGERIVVPAITIGVVPWASVPALPITGTKLPALLSSAKYCEAGLGRRFTRLGAAREAGAIDARMAWLDARGSPASATMPVVRLQEIGPVLGTFSTMSVFTRNDSTP